MNAASIIEMHTMSPTRRKSFWHPMPEVEAGSLLEHAIFYRELLAEQKEILRHKWSESEKAGQDIGFENALVNWVVHHRARWRKERRQRVREMAADEI